MQVAEAVGAALAEQGVDTVFGVVGSGNLVVTNALPPAARASSPPATRAARSRWPTAGRA